MPGGDDCRRLDFTHSRHRYWAGGSAKLIVCRVAITDSPNGSLEGKLPPDVWEYPTR